VLSWTSFERGGVEAFSMPLSPADLRSIVAILDTFDQAWTSPDGLLDVRTRAGREVVLVFRKPGRGLVADISRELVLQGEERGRFRAALAGEQPS